jgi:hypothetical protein
MRWLNIMGQQSYQPRVRKPKDKPSVEVAVGIISTWIIAALSNQRYFTLRELNEAIQDKT